MAVLGHAYGESRTVVLLSPERKPRLRSRSPDSPSPSRAWHGSPSRTLANRDRVGVAVHATVETARGSSTHKVVRRGGGFKPHDREKFSGFSPRGTQRDIDIVGLGGSLNWKDRDASGHRKLGFGSSSPSRPGYTMEGVATTSGELPRHKRSASPRSRRSRSRSRSGSRSPLAAAEQPRLPAEADETVRQELFVDGYDALQLSADLNDVVPHLVGVVDEDAQRAFTSSIAAQQEQLFLKPPPQPQAQPEPQPAPEPEPEPAAADDTESHEAKLRHALRQHFAMDTMRGEDQLSERYDAALGEIKQLRNRDAIRDAQLCSLEEKAEEETAARLSLEQKVVALQALLEKQPASDAEVADEKDEGVLHSPPGPLPRLTSRTVITEPILGAGQLTR